MTMMMMLITTTVKTIKHRSSTLVPPSTPHIFLCSWSENSFLNFKLSTSLSQGLLDALHPEVD